MTSNTRSFILGMAVGFFMGGAIGSTIMVAKAFDPCDKPYEKKPYYDLNVPYQPERDSAMDFHWQDGQPSLHPR